MSNCVWCKKKNVTPYGWSKYKEPLCSRCMPKYDFGVERKIIIGEVSRLSDLEKEMISETFRGKKKKSDSFRDNFRGKVEFIIGLVAFLYLTTLLSAPAVLLIDKIYPPLADSRFIYFIFILIGFGFWKFIKWVD